MINKLGMQFLEARRKTTAKNYLFLTLAFMLAPSIGSNKCASLLSLNSYDNTLNLWKKYGKEFLLRSELDAFELLENETRLQVLFYKPAVLENNLDRQDHRTFLQKFDYGRSISLQDLLEHLQQRCHTCLFPHEIGIFLGIPLRDVQGFIENAGKNYLLNKYWKVYHDLEKTKKIFNSYDKVKTRILDLTNAGIEPSEILTILRKTAPG